MLAVIFFVCCYFGLKIFELIINKYRRANYKLDSNSTVLITGACSGIGKQLALNFAKNLKCHIVIYDLLDVIPQTIADEIEKLGGKVHYFRCDVTNYPEVDKIIAKTLEKLSKIDILVNNAGIVVGKSVTELTMKEIEKVTAVNYLGPVNLLKQFLPKMQASNSGHIVNISSFAHCLYSGNVADYCGSKAALYHFHSSMRMELKKSGSKIAHTIVCPYVINTGMFKGASVKMAWFSF